MKIILNCMPCMSGQTWVLCSVVTLFEEETAPHFQRLIYYTRYNCLFELSLHLPTPRKCCLLLIGECHKPKFSQMQSELFDQIQSSLKHLAHMLYVACRLQQSKAHLKPTQTLSFTARKLYLIIFGVFCQLSLFCSASFVSKESETNQIKGIRLGKSKDCRSMVYSFSKNVRVQLELSFQ